MPQQSDADTAPVVSFDDEPLILVDSADNVLGHMSKAEAHAGDGVLHRAFSIFVFDADSNVLLQRRAQAKPLWGGYWSNSCCSHPRRGETVAAAAARRLCEELGVDAQLSFLYRFEYQAHFGAAGSEHELCSVYVARSGTALSVNANEISDWRYMAPSSLDSELRHYPELYTPWLRLEWPRIRDDHWARIEALLRA